MLVDPIMGFERPKLSNLDLPPFPDWGFLKMVILKDIEKVQEASQVLDQLLLTEWMVEATDSLEEFGDKERRELEAHIQKYLQGFTDKTGFKLVSCDRYSKEGHQGSKVLATTATSKGKAIVGLVGATCSITHNQENELGLRGVDTLCVLRTTSRWHVSSHYCYLLMYISFTFI